MIDKQLYKIYEACGFKISNAVNEPESVAYLAARFKLNDFSILYRTAKQTPKKVGQFVSCWKRNVARETTPIADSDAIDFFLIDVKNPINQQVGQFVFSKVILVKNDIISTSEKDGKRGFRVYPPWDIVTSKQANKTQQWQLNYFYTISNDTNLDLVKHLFQIK